MGRSPYSPAAKKRGEAECLAVTRPDLNDPRPYQNLTTENETIIPFLLDTGAQVSIIPPDMPHTPTGKIVFVQGLNSVEATYVSPSQLAFSSILISPP